MPKTASTLNPPPKYEAFLADSVKDFTCVRIIDGDFAEVEYHYDVIKLGEDDGSSTIPLTFTYKIIKGNVTKKQNAKFHDAIASILFDVISTMKKDE